MAIDPGADGVSAARGRPPLTGRQRLWVILIVFGIVVAVVALSGLLGSHKKTEPVAEHGIGRGMTYSALVEPTQVAVPKPKPVIPFTAPTKIAAPFATPKDNALEAAMFTTTGTSSDGAANARLGRNPAAPAEKDDEFTAAMTASGVGAPAKAHRMRHPALTVPVGVIIQCILQTAINSELMGNVDCVLPTPVMSADGTVELMGKGTTVTGQVRSGLRRGQNRLFILWVTARTPENVTVNLVSPAADELGRAGVDGYVNDHFWKMLLTAGLFSLIENGPLLATQALQNANKNGNNNINSYTNFLTPTQSLANTILQDDLHIPPTLEKNHGDIVTIFVVRDLDFSSVYDLSIRTTPAVSAPASLFPAARYSGERG
jgi:type IV secretion system protein VirB10